MFSQQKGAKTTATMDSRFLSLCDLQSEQHSANQEKQRAKQQAANAKLPVPISKSINSVNLNPDNIRMEPGNQQNESQSQKQLENSKETSTTEVKLDHQSSVNGQELLRNDSAKKRRRVKRESAKVIKNKQAGSNVSDDSIELDFEDRPHFRIDWRQLSYMHTPKTWSTRVNCCSTSKPENNYSLDNEQEVNEPLSNTRIILDSLDGHFESGKLSAILGPSGAGKSTFLSTLFGSRQDQASGQTRLTWLANIRRDGQSRDNERRPLRVAFLPQRDYLLHHLTVYETLLFASKLKNKRSKSAIKNNRAKTIKSELAADEDEESAWHVANVRRVARMLKLTDCLATRCAKLSGGQYKRVSIGQELLSQPDVIILDEPTSGLDASTCLSTVRTLKSVVNNGRLPISIILTIHQPDSDVFSLFDWVYVIAQGGRAIYEGPPSGILPTLAQVGIEPPNDTYNAARFIVENAFLSEPADDEAFYVGQRQRGVSKLNCDSDDEERNSYVSSIASSDEDDEDHEDGVDLLVADPNNNNPNAKYQVGVLSNALTRSLMSIKDTMSGREMKIPAPVDKKVMNKCKQSKKYEGRDEKLSRSRRLLNIGGFKTLGGQLIKADKLSRFGDNRAGSDCESEDDCASKVDPNRLAMLQRLNEIQRSVYYATSGKRPDTNSDAVVLQIDHEPVLADRVNSMKSSSSINAVDSLLCGDSKSDYSSAPSARCAIESLDQAGSSVVERPECGETTSGSSFKCSNDAANFRPLDNQFAISNIRQYGSDDLTTTKNGSPVRNHPNRRGRDFDKRLSAKHSQHESGPFVYQARLLAHRTWLSIVRDPIFFGIQAFMHTTIPILLAMIFGSNQDEGCPRVGSFDLVQFAYEQQHALDQFGHDTPPKSMISDTVNSIRLSVGNIGIVFFEMFVVIFSINCITALVFPSDMFVLLKEYRNGWYSMGSYFVGRSLADLPLPVVLHSLAMIILCLLTRQPLELWRLSLILALVIMSSLIAQSVGLTVGAILMRNSQSAVLAAAGIVAPFFALSGFIVRIHTLPYFAQLAASVSYLQHLLNGFIILRYGFNRCPCKEEDFEIDPGHQVPKQLHTMANIWVGTFNDEFSNNNQTKLMGSHNDTQLAISRNSDPNIDIVDKIMSSFKNANSFGHQMSSCKDVRPYAMLDFGLHDSDLMTCFMSILLMFLVSRAFTFAAIYYKVKWNT